jgi:hypothetical protein
LVRERSLDEQLLDAASGGDLGLCYELFACGARVGPKDEEGNTALHCLCTHDVSAEDMGSFRRLNFFSETDFSEKNKEGLTPFLCAVKFGSLIIIDYLCSTLPVGLLLGADAYGNSALHLAVLSGKPPVVELLLEKIIFTDWLVAKNNNGETSLAIARRLLVESQPDSPEEILECYDVKEYNFDSISCIFELLYLEMPDLERAPASRQSILFPKPVTRSGFRADSGWLKKKSPLGGGQ